MATAFKSLPKEQKGALLKYIIADPTTRRTADEFNYANLGLNVKNIPDENTIREFFLNVKTDGLLGYGIVTNRELGILYESKGNLALYNTFNTLTQNTEIERKLGFAEEEISNNLRLTAVTNPQNYLTQKNFDLTTINSKAITVFKEAYDKYRQFGYSDEDAFDKAKVSAKEFKNQLLKTHNKEFPENLAVDASKRIVSNIK